MNTTSPRSSSSKKSMIFSGALLTTGMAIGAVLSPLGIAGAQESDDTTPENESSESHQGRRGQRAAAVAELLGITTDDLKAGFQEGMTLAEIAADNGVSEDDLVDLLVTAMNERVDAAVEAGRIDPDRAAEIKENAPERIAERVNQAPGEGRQGRSHANRGIGREALEELGITSEEVKAGFAEGMTLAEIAAAEGVSEADLVAALVESTEAQIEAGVANGTIDAERAETVIDGLEEKITDRVNAEPGDRQGRRGGPRGQRDSGQIEDSSTT